MANLSERLKELRKSKKMTQKQMAEALQITLRQYQRYESGNQTTTLENLIKMADFFGVSLDYLVGRDHQ